MISEDVNVEASIRVALLLILDCSSCQSYQRVQRTLPCQHTVCNKCIEKSRRTGVITCAECGTLHKIPKEWTRLFPINLQLHKIANCTEMYRLGVASPGQEEAAAVSTDVVVGSGGDGGDVSYDGNACAVLLEQVQILETSEEVYDTMFSRINDDIKRLHTSGESVKEMILERMQEMRRLVDSREASLLEQTKQLEDHEIGILNTQLMQNKDEIKTIKFFCIEARRYLSAGDTKNIDELLSRSSNLMDVFRHAKTSRSRVPKLIVLVDRSAPKKRLKANINTYGKVIVESALKREDSAVLEVEGDDSNTEVLSEQPDPVKMQPPVVIKEIIQEEVMSEQGGNVGERVEILEESGTSGDKVYLRVPAKNITSSDHVRHHSDDSGIEEASISISPSVSPSRYLKIQWHETMSGATRKSRPIQKAHIDYSQFSVKLTVGGFGKSPEKFNVPKGVTAVKNDIFAVADCGNNSVKLFKSSSGSVVNCINCEEVIQFSLPSVVDVCTLGSTDLLVSISRKGKVLHYTTKGKFVNMFNVPTTGKSSDIWGITSDLQENIYICDRANGCVLVFDKEMNKLREFRSSSKKGSCPFYVAIGPHGLIYTTDSMSNTIQIFSPNGNRYNESYGDKFRKGFQNFQELAGIAFDSTGNLLIVDRGQSKILVIEPRMANQYQFGKDIGSIGKPEGIAVLANGQVVVSETAHHQALIF